MTADSPKAAEVETVIVSDDEMPPASPKKVQEEVETVEVTETAAAVVADTETVATTAVAATTGTVENVKSDEKPADAGAKPAGESDEKEEKEQPVEEEEVEDPTLEKDEEFGSADEEDRKCVEPGAVQLNQYDSTFNSISTDDGRCMLSVTPDGLTNLFTGMRANIGFKTGRYYFEIKMLDMPRQTRVGFSACKPFAEHCKKTVDKIKKLEELGTTSSDSTSNTTNETIASMYTTSSAMSDLLLDDENSFGFDCLGTAFAAGVKTTQSNPRWSRTDIVGVLLNINKKTVSLYLNGTLSPTGHVSTIPDSFFDEKGCLKDPLYPTVACKQSAVECNFSWKVWKNLPFKVRTVGQAKKSDIVTSPMLPDSAQMKEKFGSDIWQLGKLEGTDEAKVHVIMPIGFEVNSMIYKSMVENYPDAMVITYDSISGWAEGSGNVFDPKFNNHHSNAHLNPKKYRVNCIDQPNNVFPMLLQGGKRYIYSCSQYNNLNPRFRDDTILKIKHTTNAEVTALVNVQSIIDMANGSTSATCSSLIRDKFQDLTLPGSNDEKFDFVKYVGGSETIANEKFEAWKRECKLKSKVPGSELKKSGFFAKRMAEFEKYRLLRHKTESLQHRALLEKQKVEAKEAKIAQKAAAKAEAKAAAEAEGLNAEEIDAAIKSDDEGGEDEEDEPLPEILEDWSEEDWMLAKLRTELHACRINFDVTVNEYVNNDPSSNACLPTGYDFKADNFDGLARLVTDVFAHTENVDDFSLRKDKNSSPLIKEYDLVLPSSEVSDASIATVDYFIQKTDEQRQERTDRLDAGDENAALTFKYKPQPPQSNRGGMNNMNRYNSGGQQIQNNTMQQQGQGGQRMNSNNSQRRTSPPPNNNYDYNAKRHRGNSGNVSGGYRR